jgi:hypothetical protein
VHTSTAHPDRISPPDPVPAIPAGPRRDRAVKTHVGSLLAKLHARDRAQLVIAAYDSGLVAPA